LGVTAGMGGGRELEGEGDCAEGEESGGEELDIEERSCACARH